MLNIKKEVFDDDVEVVCTPSSSVFDHVIGRPRRRGRPSKNSNLMCALCDFQTEEFQFLDEHMKTHMDKVAYSCPYCKSLFSQKGNLQAHIRTHTKERPYKCKMCNFASTQKGNLNVHIRKHTKEKPYRCHHCDFTAAQVANLRSHLLRKHSGTHMETDVWRESKMYRCGQCQFVCRMKNDMVEHVRLLHPNVYTPSRAPAAGTLLGMGMEQRGVTLHHIPQMVGCHRINVSPPPQPLPRIVSCEGNVS